LQRIDPTGAPRAGRGVPLAERDAPTRTAIDELLGDPAGDLAVAWNLFPPDTRNLVRAALRVDDATWERGRGWALSIALIQVPYYQSTNAVLAASARHVINEVLADHARVSC
jgi:aminoglycoside phosphotransferase (APT) family kinase protein